MYKVPLTNSPNQSFSCTIPVNGENKTFNFFLSYNNQAKYWSMTVTDDATQEELFTNIPMIFSNYRYFNIASQFGYMNIGSIYICPINETPSSAPDDTNIGKNYILVWGDNE